MANRRMITKDTFEDLNFERLERVNQYIYFVATLYADDEGYIKLSELIYRARTNNKEILSLVEAGFFELSNEIISIKNWLNEQEIKSDRFKESLLKQYFSERRQNGDNLETKRIHNVSLDKSRLEKSRVGEVLKTYNEVWKANVKSSKAWQSNYTKWLEDYTHEDIIQAIRNMRQQAWIKTLPDRFNLESFFRTDKDWIGACLDLQVKENKDTRDGMGRLA